jgi:uncharacterized membrane protein YheB (UPF0754 family)
VDSELAQFLLTVAIATLAGGITNAVAVWMLFHPYRPPELFGRPVRWLQGAVPKNQARLASAMGRTVGTKLLTPDDLAGTLAEPAFRAAFDERLSAFLTSVFEERRGALSELLPEPVLAPVREVLVDASGGVLARLDNYLASDSFRAAVERWIELVREEVQDRPISELLTTERQVALTSAADRWLQEAVEGDAFAGTIRDYVDRVAVRLLQPDRTFEELLPLGLVAALERAIASYLPIAIERLGGMLDDPAARRKVEQLLHELLGRFMSDLKFHQLLVAALFITPDTIDRVIKAIEREGAAKISELLQDDEMREAMARGVNNAIVDFLRRPVVSVLGHAGDESVVNAKETLVKWAVSLARDAQTRTFAVEKIQALVESGHDRTWSDVLRHLPTDRAADAIVAAARSERARELYQDGLLRGIDWILHRPIGRIADHVGVTAPARVQAVLADPLWAWLQEQIPPIAQRLDIAGRVQKKILEFPMPQLDALIRGVIERELQLIVQLGYVLGGLIGLLTASVALLF